MPTLFMASLGCAKNLVDAETMLGETLSGGFGLTLDPEEADLIIINTCGFIEDARQEARDVIGEYLELKKRSRREVKVAAAGCWAQRAPEDVRREFPALDAVWGLGIPSDLAEAFREMGLSPVAGISLPERPREGARLVSTLPSFAYLRLSDGCDNRCHYCAIPLIRGSLRSRDAEAILEEAKSLEQQGASELALISQDTTAYGADLGTEGTSLDVLLESLLRAVAVPRIRVLYAHPAHLTRETAALIRSEPRLCRYLDLPVQHASDRILTAMGRGYGRERILEVLDWLGENVTVRTTFLAGFPGETEEDFREALELIRNGRFRHLGAFAYSPEPGTPAAAFPDQVPPETARARRDAMMEAQREPAFSWLDSRIGKQEQILIDSRLDREWVLGRSVHEAPDDTDGAVYVRDGKSAPGQLIQACITARQDYDLVAERASAGKDRRPGRRRAGR